MQDDSQLSSDGNARSLAGVLAPTSCNALAVSSQVGVGPVGSEDVGRRLHKEAPQEGIARLRDPELRCAVAGVLPPRHQADVGSHISALWESGRVFDHEREGERGHGPDAGDLLQRPALGVLSVNDGLDLTIVGTNRGRDLLDHLEERSEGRPKGKRHMLGRLAMEGGG